MHFLHATKTNRSRSPFLSGFLYLFAILAVLLAVGCTSPRIIVGDEGGTISHPMLKECSGVLFKLTVEQNLQGKPPVSVSVEARAVAGQIRFRSRDLNDIELNNIVTLKLEVLQVPSNPGTVECPFQENETYITGPIILRRVADTDGDPTYVVDLDEFEKQ